MEKPHIKKGMGWRSVCRDPAVPLQNVSRIKQPVWKGMAIANKPRRMTQACVTLYGCYKNKNRSIWFADVELHFCNSNLWAPVKNGFFFRPIVLSSFGCFYEPAFYQPINSNLNILNLTEHALDISSPALNAPPSNFLLISRSQWEWWKKWCPQNSSRMQEFTRQQGHTEHRVISSQQSSSSNCSNPIN